MLYFKLQSIGLEPIIFVWKTISIPFTYDCLIKNFNLILFYRKCPIRTDEKFPFNCTQDNRFRPLSQLSLEKERFFKYN